MFKLIPCKPIIVTVFFAATLNGCASQEQVAPAKVEISKEARLLYKGNSAAMMSTIGITGIAIGVAIDEGIAKELEEGLISTGENSQTLLLTCMKQESLTKSKTNISRVTIESYAIVPRDNGFFATISGSLNQNGQDKTFEHGQRALGETANLNQLKTNPMITKSLMLSTCKDFWGNIAKNEYNIQN
ncbi:hypothetical protein HGO26_17205 [Shewanella sp. S-1]|uniref:Lipoprotein n=1 Tax=Shewanella oncorhynchi TaxID=2726434 RepID=A0ABX1KQX5_9GAMM|nr:hypothetical protein [Shewanella oncorhynchi]NLQ24610.1 hypothetical protein [Shewanella oncorhynchi]